MGHFYGTMVGLGVNLGFEFALDELEISAVNWCGGLPASAPGNEYSIKDSRGVSHIAFVMIVTTGRCRFWILFLPVAFSVLRNFQPGA
jgi:hypothetical protein